MARKGKNMETTLARLLTVKEVAEILGCQPSTIYKYSSAGKIPTVHVCGFLRFREDQILDFLEANTKPAIKSTV